MNSPPSRFTIVIPTKNRSRILTELLQSIFQLDGIEAIRPEIIVADNDSTDTTYDDALSFAKSFPVAIQVVKISRPGKSAAINDAVKVAGGDILAFLDDDVVVDRNWLTAIETFFRAGRYRVGQGRIQLQSPAGDDPEVLRLVERYRTIPSLSYDADTDSTHSLNGANFFLCREAFNLAGGLDERLGPGASGTSEDVDLARRLARAGIAIGYAPEAIVYHRVDRERLTEKYFKNIHRRQGASRFLLSKRTTGRMLFNVAHAAGSYAIYTLLGKERERYRSKGRVYHYLGMLEAQYNRPRRPKAP